MDRIIKIKKSDNYRIVAISDIHARLDLIEELLEKVQLREEDYLVIIGDFINKGPNSIGCLNLVRELLKRPKTICLKGNHELFIGRVLDSFDYSKRLLDYLRQDNYKTLIHDFAEIEGKSLHDYSYEEFFSLMNATYYDDLNFIKSLPIILEFDDFLFVHGGYDRSFDAVEDENKFLKYDNYKELGHVNEKTVVVGHWPTANLRTHTFTNVPFFEEEKNIIMIDGGMGVKTGGEMNALVINKTNGLISYEHKFVNDFEATTIKKKMTFNQEQTVLVNYPHFEVEVIEVGEELTLCKHVHSGNHLSVINSVVKEAEEGHVLDIVYTNKFFNLEVGDVVGIIDRKADYVLVKYEHEIGWVHKSQI